MAVKSVQMDGIHGYAGEHFKRVLVRVCSDAQNLQIQFNDETLSITIEDLAFCLTAFTQEQK